MDRGVDDRLERGKLGRIAEHSSRQRVAVDDPVAGRPREALLDRRDQPPAGSLQAAASASNTGIPSSANIAATVDLPMPIDPVSASVIMRAALA